MKIKNIKPKRKLNRFVQFCVDTYYTLLNAQRERMESICLGYDTEEKIYFDKVEPKVLYKDVIIACAREWRAMNCVSLAA